MPHLTSGQGDLGSARHSGGEVVEPLEKIIAMLDHDHWVDEARLLLTSALRMRRNDADI